MPSATSHLYPGTISRNRETYRSSLVIHPNDVRCLWKLLFRLLLIASLVLPRYCITAFLAIFVVLHTLLRCLCLDIVGRPFHRVVSAVSASPAGRGVVGVGASFVGYCGGARVLFVRIRRGQT